VIETCEPCPSCGEVTPHSRRRWAPRRLAAALCVALALALLAAAFWLRDDDARVGAFAAAMPLGLLAAAIWLWHADNALRWDLACTRCRTRAFAGRRRWLGRHTTIDPF